MNFAFRIEKLASSVGTLCLLSDTANTILKGHMPTKTEGRHPVTSFDGEFEFHSF